MKVAVAGASGRMGQEICELIRQDENFELSGEFSRCRPIKNVKPGADVLIDFSLPEQTDEVCDWCVENRVALVSGVTGLSDRDLAKIEDLSKSLPVLWSRNMSLGIAWLNQVVREVAKLDGFDFQIIESHHRRKIDAPSGTAALLQETLNGSLEDQGKSRAPEPLSIRGGGIFGQHQIMAMSEEETIVLEHTALNRTVFARGAVTAAAWLRGKKPGLYSMHDVLKK